jgi:hypothetical protein
VKPSQFWEPPDSPGRLILLPNALVTFSGVGVTGASFRSECSLQVAKRVLARTVALALVVTAARSRSRAEYLQHEASRGWCP